VNPLAGRRRRAVGWAAVAAQFALLGGLLLAAGAAPRSPGWLWWTGSALLAGGLVVVAVGALQLGRSLTPTPVPNGAGLRTAGLYRWVRHPIYTGVLLAALGVALRSFSVWTAVCWTALLALLTAKARWEERLLAEVFWDYPGYAARTGRFLPRP
jgi:protein-S-isoprenylcysteine O-methyltransferase Ste14